MRTADVELLMASGNISFSGSDERKRKALVFIDKCLKKQGDLGAYGDLSCGLAELQKNKSIAITTQSDSYYYLSVFPPNEYTFSISRETGRVGIVP